MSRMAIYPKTGTLCAGLMIFRVAFIRTRSHTLLINRGDETMTATIKLPYRLEPFGHTGWTVSEMSAEDAARFVARHPNAAMPCWRRFDTIDGELVQVR
jgi:hypothetical protein